MEKENIGQKLHRIIKELPPSVTLIAVSKTFPLSDIALAYRWGQRHFGENRVQELELKAREAAECGMDLRWHFLGPIQSNKLKKLLTVPHLEAIHSIASLRQISLLEKRDGGRAVKIFLQVNTSGEEEKSGFSDLRELRLAIARCRGFADRFPLAGLMTMGAIRVADFNRAAEDCFQRLVAIRDQLGIPLQLSMGMSGDYSIALRYGTDYIRVGRKIFGERTYIS